MVNYIGKKQEKYNREVPDEDEDETIDIDYETIVKVKFFLEFPTWKEFYIFLKTHIFSLSAFTDSDFFTNFPKIQWMRTDLPNWINRDNFYLEYKRTAFYAGERNAFDYMIYRLKEIGSDYNLFHTKMK